MAQQTRKAQTILVTLACFFYYLALVLSRYGLSAAIPGIVSSGTFTKAQLGQVASAFFLGYALMQLPSGLLGDRLSAPRMMIAGAIGAGLTNLLFPMAKSLTGLTVIWFLNGFSQAFVAASLMRVLSLSVVPAFRATAVLIVCAGSPIGVLLTYALTAWLSPRGWQAFFFVAGGFMLLMVFLWAVFEKRLTEGAAVEAAPGGKFTIPFARMKKEYLACGLGLIAIVSFLHGMLKDGLSTWVPVYLAEVFSMTDRSALILSMVLPVVNLFGLFFVQVYTGRSKGNELTGSTVVYAFSTAATLLMAFVFTKSLPGMLVSFALLTSSMQIINTFIIGLVPMRFAPSGLVATTTGVLDACIYLGSACSGVLFGTVAEHTGWDGTRMLWVIIAVAGAVCSLFAIKKWTAYRAALATENTVPADEAADADKRR